MLKYSSDNEQKKIPIGKKESPEGKAQKYL